MTLTYHVKCIHKLVQLPNKSWSGKCSREIQNEREQRSRVYFSVEGISQGTVCGRREKEGVLFHENYVWDMQIYECFALMLCRKHNYCKYSQVWKKCTIYHVCSFQGEVGSISIVWDLIFINTAEMVRRKLLLPFFPDILCEKCQAASAYCFWKSVSRGERHRSLRYCSYT